LERGVTSRSSKILWKAGFFLEDYLFFVKGQVQEFQYLRNPGPANFTHLGNFCLVFHGTICE